MDLIDYLSNKILRGNQKSAFIISEREKISYDKFEEETDTTSSYLKKLGIEKGNKITILSDNNSDFIQIVFSLWKIKAIPVPLNINLFPKEIEEQIKVAECRFVLVHEGIKFKSKNTDTIIFPFKERPKENILNKRYNGNDTALIMFTSGSSGNHKAVELTFDNLIQSCKIGDQILNQDENDRWLASLPFYHIGGFSIIVRTFLSGASLIIPGSLKIDDIISAVKKFQPTLASFVSTQLKRLLEKDVSELKELKNILIGGGFTSDELILKALKKDWKITKVYGSTEVASFVSAITYKELFNKPGSSGKALYPNKIIIVNNKKENLPANSSGEIAVKSASVMKGYYQSSHRWNSEEVSKKLLSGFYYTGDYGYLDEKGYLFVEARREDLIVSGGENILPKQLEAEIFTHPFVDDVFVFGMPNEEWGEEVCSAVVVKKNKEINSDELREFLKDKLPGYKIPKKIYFVDEIPRTSLGKVQKDKLLKSVLG